MWEGVIDKVSRPGLILLNPQNFKNGVSIEDYLISLNPLFAPRLKHA